MKRVLAASSFFVLFAAGAAAQCELQELQASPSAAGEAFGSAVAIDGDRALVGVPGAERVEVWMRTPTGWTRTAQLTPAPGESGGFGTAVALRGTTAVIGIPGYQAVPIGAPEGGAAVFELLPSGWKELDLLTRFRPESSAFGQAVAIDGDAIVVGAPTRFGIGTGDAYTFVRDDGGTPADPSDDHFVPDRYFPFPLMPAEQEAFGYAVAVEGDVAVITAPGYWGWEIPSNCHGALFTSVRVGGVWQPLQPVIAMAPSWDYEPYDLGKAVALSGDRLLATASWTLPGGRSGCAFLFQRDRMGTADPTDDVWRQIGYFDRVQPGGPQPPQDGFGLSCALDGERFVVGAPYAVLSPPLSHAYVYERVGAGWIQTGRLTACPPVSGDAFGTSLAIAGTDVLVGAPSDDEPGADAGAVHAFEFRSLQALTSQMPSSSNPVAFRQLSPPIVGGTWQTSVDLAATGAFASVVAIVVGPTTRPTPVATPYGMLLVPPPFAVLDVAADLHAIPIPNACSLLGTLFWSQAAAFGHGSVQLLNGLEGNLGTF